MENVTKEVEVGINVDTSELDEAIEKADELCEVTQDFSPMVSIRGCKNCTFNIYPSRTIINEGDRAISEFASELEQLNG